MTFIVETYNNNNTASIDGAGDFVINCGTGIIAFQAKDAGVQKISYAPTVAGARNLTLTTGTLNVDGIDFIVGANATNINRTEGSLVGSPTYSNNAMILTYDGTTSKTAGGEVPGTLGSLVLSNTAASKIIFNSAITFGATGGGISGTTGDVDADFNALVTMKPSVTAGVEPVPTIANNQSGADWTFVGGVTFQSADVANGTPLLNSGSGTIKVTGALVFEQQDATNAEDNPHTFAISNTGTGSLSVIGGVFETVTSKGSSSAYSANHTPVVDFNLGAGTATIGGGTSTTFTGTYGTSGGSTATLNGPITISGIITNAGTTASGGYTLTVTSTGTHTSAGNISGTGTLLITNDGSLATTWNGAGQLPNVEVANKAILTVAAATQINGTVTSNSTGLTTLSAATNITGGILINSSGSVTLGAGTTSIGGNVSVTGSGVLTTNVATIGGSMSLSNGGVTLGGDVILSGDYNQTGGTITFGTFTFNMKGDFTRTVGTIVPGFGTLQFSSGGAQTFSGGTNMRVYNFKVTGVGTGITFVNGSLEVENNAEILSNTTVALGTLNIRMLGAAPNAATNNRFMNGGEYSSSGGGGIIFEAPSGTTSYLEGNGINSNIEVRLGSETDVVQISDGHTVTWSGLLTLTRGTIQVGDGAGGSEQFNPSTIITTPTIRRNLGDTSPANGTADGYPIDDSNADGTFNATNQAYHLLYFGTLTANQGVGSEFVAGSTPRVIDLTINANGGGFAVQVPDAIYAFSGNLTVANSAILQLLGTGSNDLISTGTDVTHTINGSVVTTTVSLLLNGTGVVNGGTKTTATADDASIDILTVNTTDTTYNLNGLWNIGTLRVSDGTVNVGMQTRGTPADEGDIGVFAITDGTVNLTADADLTTSFTISNGIFDLHDYNLILNTAGGSFTATGGAIQNTDADSKGFVVFDASGAFTLNTGTVNVPRIQQSMSTSVTANVTLTGNSGFSQIYNQKAGALELNANTLRLAGTDYNYTAGTIVSTAGNGLFEVDGITNLNLSADMSIPNLELDDATDSLSLVDNDGATSVPTLAISDPNAAPGVLTLTAGHINMQALDIQLDDAGTVFSYAAGTLEAVTTNSVDVDNDKNGELVFSGSGAQTLSLTNTGLVIPNVRIDGTSDVSLPAVGAAGHNAFTISDRLVLESTGDLNFIADGVLTLGDGAWVKRMNNGGILDKVPTFGEKIYNEYEATAAIVSGKEQKSSITGLYINNSVGIDVDATQNLTVEEILYLNSGDYDFEQTANTIYTITMGENSTVYVNGGTLDNSGSTTVTSLLGGPVTLEYVNSAGGVLSTTSSEFPATDGFVSTLKVMSPKGSGGVDLHADRTVGDLFMETGIDLVAASPTHVNTVPFDLNGNDLTVSSDSSATLNRGVLTNSLQGTSASTLDVAGYLITSANSTINDVIVNVGKDATLAGNYASTATPTESMTIQGNATFAAFTGNATVFGGSTINGAFKGTLTAYQDIDVTLAGGLDAGTSITFTGDSNPQNINLAGDDQITNLTINKANSSNEVHLNGGSLILGDQAVTAASTGTVTFTRGLLIIEDGKELVLDNPTGNTAGQGFVDNVASGDMSHVVGTVTQGVKTGTNTSNGRTEFPVGTKTASRRVAITIVDQGINPGPVGVDVSVNHQEEVVEGAVGLPIDFNDHQYARYPDFFWNIWSTADMGNIDFDLSLTAEGFDDFDAIENVVILRREGTTEDITNNWDLQGEEYDNFRSNGIPTVVNENSSGGIRPQNAIFTYGMRTRLSVENAIDDVIIGTAGGDIVPTKYGLEDRFSGFEGDPTYSATSTNEAIATVAVDGDTLLITPVSGASGETYITVKALDTNRDFTQFTFKVEVDPTVTDLDDILGLPTEFSLKQNYPNPFNPTTVIRYGLPQEANVVLKIYNILGEEVKTLVNTVQQAGWHEINFDASKLTSGLYIYRIEAQDFVEVKKMMLIK
ncbi:MAG: T9SS type A sorting domain-containing protein [Ignavibacteria bacterium]